MANFTPYSAFIGGLLIGAAASLLLWLNGKIAGVSGILGQLLPPVKGDAAWRALFLAGLVLGVFFFRLFDPMDRGIAIAADLPVLIAGGLLVGFGTRLGGGCTSGHGVCGIARLSLRSIVATLTFLATAVVTVALVRHGLGG
ncbi:MAG: YeeE/YedE family protein [Alphaproteobacteria bacterium]|nr:YeeE/YedE family protein [Alphaproteobacteria bacterium]